MKILVLGSSLNAKCGGLAEYLRMFAKYFGQRHQVEFLSIAMQDLKQEVVINNYSPNVREVEINSPDFFGDSTWDTPKYAVLEKVFNVVFPQFQPDIIITNDWFWTPVLMMHDQKMLTYYFCHAFYKALYELFHRESQRIIESERIGMYEECDKIIANSVSTAKDIAKFYPELRAKTVPLLLGVDKAEYQPMPNMESKVILYMGRYQPEKGLDGFIKNVKAYLPQLAQGGYQVWFAGKGNMLDAVDDLEKASNGVVIHLGTIDGEKKKQVIAQAGYAIAPSYYEPYSLTVNEMLASGKVVIASATGGHTEQIQNGKNGFLLKPENNQAPDYIGKVFEVEANPKKKLAIIQNAVSSARDINSHFALLEKEMLDDIRKFAQAPAK